MKVLKLLWFQQWTIHLCLSYPDRRKELCLYVEFDRIKLESCKRLCENGGLTVQSQGMVLVRLRALVSMGQCEIV